MVDEKNSGLNMMLARAFKMQFIHAMLLFEFFLGEGGGYLGLLSSNANPFTFIEFLQMTS